MLYVLSEWEGTAIGVLDECRKQNDELAQRLIVKALPDFGHLTSIDIAVSAEDQDFIAHPTCQALLGKLWMGALALGTHTWQVRLCSVIQHKLRHACQMLSSQWYSLVTGVKWL